MTSTTARLRRWSRLSQVDAPAPLTPPSPVLSASQSWTSGEIPIFLDPSHSTGTLRLSVANSTSLFPAVGSVDTFGQPVRRSTSTASRLSYTSVSESSSSDVSIPTTVSYSVLEYGGEGSYGTPQVSASSLSAYLASASLYGDTDANRSEAHDLPPVAQQRVLDVQSSITSFVSTGKRERPRTLNDLAHPDRAVLQFHRGFNLNEPNVPSSPTSTSLLSPVASTASEHTTDPAAHIHQQRRSRVVSAPLIQPHVGATLESPQRIFSPSPARPRSNSNPHLSIASPSSHPSPLTTSIPEWLRGMRIELWIDQEGFRAIQPRLELISFSRGAGINAAGETLDVAEFAMRTWQTWHFHYAPLDSAPVLRRLTVNGDMNDYISRQAALTLKENGMYAVESTEDKGRVAWKFEYRVEDRRAQGTGKILDGEKRFTPLRFVCNPTLLSAEHGKKVKLLQFMRKSVTPKLQSARLGHGTSLAGAMNVPRIVVREGKAIKEAAIRRGRGLSLSNSHGADTAKKQQHHAENLAGNLRSHNDVLNHTRSIPVAQPIISPSVLNEMVRQLAVVDKELPPPPWGDGPL